MQCVHEIWIRRQLSAYYFRLFALKLQANRLFVHRTRDYIFSFAIQKETLHSFFNKITIYYFLLFNNTQFMRHKKERREARRWKRWLIEHCVTADTCLKARQGKKACWPEWNSSWSSSFQSSLLPKVDIFSSHLWEKHITMVNKRCSGSVLLMPETLIA